ncbi:MATE family efflux transporter [Clostridium aminobutyricum]|uniref:Probable multidrug resistance protein NorM n=1 Tax=Clostridium aminobutyricum TaxID=33953 RepID=A0A939D7A9_CLOAM|nr:MATE family efflux transporter [Clostridium aminobutyricum]MBN7772411.1 MATE family efflux transporter [Clostridium aminobutyricum]
MTQETKDRIEGIEKQNETERKEHNIKENKMASMPVGKLMLGMAWPAMLSMFIQALYNIVDSIYVAKVSEASLTAVSLAFPIQMLMISVAVGTGVGVNSLIARRLGARRFEEANMAASHGFRIAFINWAVFALFGFFFSKMYMAAYTDSPYILEQGTAYLVIVTVCSLFVFVQVNTEKVLQATGNMLLPMACSLTGAIINIILGYILIFGHFGFPEMGVVGSAVATVVGQFISMCMGLVLLLGKKHEVTVKIRGFKFSGQITKDIYSVGFPSVVMQAIVSVMLFFVNGILAFSETAVAVLGIYFKLNSFIFLPIFGLNQGAMPIIGYNYGAKNRDRLMKTYKLGFKISLVIMCIGTLLFLLLPAQLLLLFDASENMIIIGTPALRIISLCFLPAAFGIMTSTLFQATGHGMLSLWMSLIRQLVGIVPLAFLLTSIGGLALVWWAWPLAEILGTIYCIIFLNRLYKKEISTLS